MKRLLPFLLLLSPLALAGLGCSDFDYQVTGIEARMVASPTLVDFGALAVGAEGSGTLDLVAAEGSIRVLAVELSGPDAALFSVQDSLPEVDTESPAQLAVGYHPVAAGYHWAELILVTDEAEERSTHTVSLRGQALPGMLELSPAILDFGPVAAGASRDESVTLRNPGEVALQIQGIELSGLRAGSFEALDLPLSLAAGAEGQLSLRFSAADTDPESVTASLQVLGLSEPAGLLLRANDCETADSEVYDRDADGVSWCAGDCDDEDDSARPGAAEVCDGQDDDCDGLTDEGTSCYDNDGDGLSADEGDCNDGDAQVSPLATEVPANGVDDDCDGVVDDGAVDLDGDGVSTSGGDCDDGDASVRPGAPEACDGDDEDCDGLVDEGTSCSDNDGDGSSADEGDCDDTDPAVYAGAAERANGVDDDCDGAVDEGTTWHDDDGDGISERGGDCDDADPAVNPGAVESAGDGIDNDCDGSAE
ncbi:choice-of-anchor D domain-containing protein [Myxococcota bacterium]|nr:choice-of-anchor D domain-containing protein [Myxococcota bacterium]